MGKETWKNARLLEGLILVLVAFVSAYFGIRASLLRHSEEPLKVSSSGLFSDGWLADKASFEFAETSGFGNYVSLSLDGWRPAGVEPARVVVMTCEHLLFQGQIPPSGIRVSGRAPWTCAPLAITIKNENPFQEPNNSGRALSVKFRSVDASSLFGPAVRTGHQVRLYFAALVMSTLIVWLILWPLKGATVGAALTAALLGWALACHELPNGVSFWWWVILMCSVCTGIRLTPYLIEADQTKAARSGVYALALTLLVVGGLALRLYGITFGIPEWYHPDEVKKTGVILNMYRMSTFDPNYFLHPSLLLYFAKFLSYGVIWWNGSAEMTRIDAAIAGRLVSVLAGSLSIAAVYFLGKELYSRFVGIVAGALLAVFPLHVTCSRYLKEDALLTLWIIVAALFFARAVRTKRSRDIALLIIACGLACGTKYSGLLTAILPALLPWFSSRRVIPDWSVFRRALAFSPLLPLTFIATTPYSILNSSKFLGGLAFEKAHLAEGHGMVITPWQYLWTFHFDHSLSPGMTSFVCVLAFVAVGFLLGRRTLSDVIVLLLVALLYLPAEAVSSKPPPQPDRYVLPCLPFLAIAVAELLRALTLRLGIRWVPTLAIALVVGVPLMRSLQLASEIYPDTRQIMDRWMRENIRDNATIYVAGGFAPRLKGAKFEAYRDQSRDPGRNPEARDITDYDYILMSSMHYDRFFQFPYPKEMKRRFERFLALPIVKKVEPKFGTYGFHNPTVVLVRMKANPVP